MCYRGSVAPGALYWFYDACANRDFTVGVCALGEGREVLAVACGATSAEGGVGWLRRRRRWRSLIARLGNRDLALGGWPGDLLTSLADKGRTGYLLSLVASPALAADGVQGVFGVFAAAMASHGVGMLCAPSPKADARLEDLGFRPAGGPRKERYEFFVYWMAL